MSLTHNHVETMISRVPTAERHMAALVIKNKAYTWEQVLVEMKKKSALSTKMINKIEEIIKNGRKN